MLVTGNSQLNTSSLGLEVRSLYTVSVVNFLCKFIFIVDFCLSKVKNKWILSFAGSSCNSSNLTFDGVDVMGRRLVEEVYTTVKNY